MSFNDIREFMAEIKQDGELVELNKTLTEGYEVLAINWKLNDEQGPAYIGKMQNYDIPIVNNLFGTFDRWAVAAGLPRGKTEKEYKLLCAKLMRQEKKEPVEVDKAPCQEVVFTGDQVDLSRYPIMKWFPPDGANYITMGMVVTEDQKFGTNVGLYRMSVRGKNEITVLTNMNQDIGVHLSRARAKGKNTIPVAVVIGGDPAVYLSSVTKVGLQENEYKFSSIFKDGEPVKLVKCKTVPLYVPAGAEIVFEGELTVQERVDEGPYGEYSGYLEEPMRTPTIKINCITQREEPIYVNTTPGHMYSEETTMRFIQTNASFYNDCEKRVSGFVDAHLPVAGRGFTGIAAINKRLPGLGKHAIMQVYAIPYATFVINNIIIVDGDVDPSDLKQVMWAISTRVDPQRDVILFPPAGMAPLNPAARLRPEVFDPTGITDISICSKMGIDATIKRFGQMEGHYRPPAQVVRPGTDKIKEIEANWREYGF